ncbi:MAG: hypothetical protein IJO21_05820 [Oscillospiraceae bacterium]|nr:hypothetical protein [Oscillospiraceae bacterium]
MLYATTRNNCDAYTAQRVLTLNRGSDGGLIVPYRIPRFTREEIASLAGKGFSRNLADCLNLLFNTRLTGFDMDLAIGKSPVRLQQLGQKMMVAECWHNTDWHFDRMILDLAKLVCVDREAVPEIRGWAGTGIRIAVLFGVFGELIREGVASFDKKVDISVVTGDFSAPMAAWYARFMGLPIGNIICCCNENGNLWNFICHGQMRTDGIAVKTLVPEGDVIVPEGLERLIDVYGGPAEANRFVEILRRGGLYHVEDGFLRRLRQGIYATVTSDKRILATIPNVYTTCRYLLSPGSALAYAGLQDYRARTGEMRCALVMAGSSPRTAAAVTAAAMGTDEKELRKYC